MIDRELLELAAKAAKRDFRWEGDVLVLNDAAGHECSAWNPLEDDGDALRITKCMRLRIDTAKDGEWIVSNTSPSSKGFFFVKDADLNRAIVRAAAQIGAGKDAA